MEHSESLFVPLTPSEGNVLPIFGTVIFPQTIIPLAISSPEAVRLVDRVLEGDGLLTMVAVRAERFRPVNPAQAERYSVGTLAEIHRLLRLPDNTLRIAVEGLERITIGKVISHSPYLYTELAAHPDRYSDPQAVDQSLKTLLRLMQELSEYLPVMTEELQAAILQEDPPARLSYLIAITLASQMTVNEQQGILEIDTVLGRLERLTSIVERELERMRSRNNEERETLVQQSLFERRPELLQLPAVQEAYTSGRIEGMRKIIIQIAAERFRVDQAYPPLLEHIHHFHEEAELEQLALRVISAANFDEFMAAIE
jgi:ATP-dependent Lon protease